MYKKIYKHLKNYLDDNGVLSPEIKDELKECDNYEDKLKILVEYSCDPEVLGLESISEILGLQFDPQDYEDLLEEYSDMF